MSTCSGDFSLEIIENKNILEIESCTNSSNPTNVIVQNTSDSILEINTTCVNPDHPTVSAPNSVDNSGNIFIQDIFLDSNGHITGINSAESTSSRPKRTYKTVSVNYSVLYSDDLLFLNSSSSEIYITMPLASGAEGYTFTMKKIAGNNNCIIQPQSGEYIDSQSGFNVHYNNSSFSFFSDGSNWYVI